MPGLIQSLHDYLIKTGLVTETQLEVWESESLVFSSHDYSGGHDLIKRRVFKANLFINNLTDGFDRDAIEFALVWWLNVWGPPAENGAPRFTVEADIENRKITDLWVGFELEEKSRLLPGGAVVVCNKPNIIQQEIDRSEWPHYFRFVNQGLTVQISD